MRTIFTITVFALSLSNLFGQAVPDTSFSFIIENPEYENQRGPVICIDSAHNNLHTKEGSFSPFSKLLSIDGYVVRDLNTTFKNKSGFKDCKVLVISNAIHSDNEENWAQPIYPAFTEEEVGSLSNWIKQGGRLLLIADHMPFAGAANILAKTFGFEYSDGFARLANEPGQWDVFSKENGRLRQHDMTEDIPSLTTFTGSGFIYPGEAQVLMAFNEEDYSLEPEVAWQFDTDTDTVSLNGYAQGAILEYEKGKIAVFGEAAMFTARDVTTQDGRNLKVGFNSPSAPNNKEFIIKLMRYLAKD